MSKKSGTYADIEEDEHIDKYQYIIDISINLNMISLTYHAYHIDKHEYIIYR